jgi:general secretion pathway protein I
MKAHPCRLAPGCPRPSGSGEHGFTLLEAIVAIAIASGVGGALFALVNSTLDNYYRVEAAHERQVAKRTAYEYIQTINPMKAPTGKQRLGPYRVRWEAKPVKPVMPARQSPVGSNYNLGLYRLQVKVEKDGKAFTAFTLRRVGYKRELSRVRQ